MIRDNEVIDLLANGVPIRWVPKSVIYDKVIGEDTRSLFVGSRRLTRSQEMDMYDSLSRLVKEGVVKVKERKIGICDYVLTYAT